MLSIYLSYGNKFNIGFVYFYWWSVVIQMVYMTQTPFSSLLVTFCVIVIKLHMFLVSSNFWRQKTKFIYIIRISKFVNFHPQLINFDRKKNHSFTKINIDLCFDGVGYWHFTTFWLLTYTFTSDFLGLWYFPNNFLGLLDSFEFFLLSFSTYFLSVKISGHMKFNLYSPIFRQWRASSTQWCRSANTSAQRQHLGVYARRRQRSWIFLCIRCIRCDWAHKPGYLLGGMAKFTNFCHNKTE